VVGDQQRGYPRVVHPDAHPVAGHPRLGDLEQRRADLVPVADAHLVIGQAADGEVLPELPVAEVAAAELALPVLVGPDLVDEHRPVLAAVPGQVPCPSPSMFSRRTSRAPATGFFHTPVCTVRPCHGTSCGSPTFTDSRRPDGRPSATTCPPHNPPGPACGVLAGRQRTVQVNMRGVARPMASRSASLGWSGTDAAAGTSTIRAV
jgi:hypothetical protein